MPRLVRRILCALAATHGDVDDCIDVDAVVAAATAKNANGYSAVDCADDVDTRAVFAELLAPRAGSPERRRVAGGN
ncbi:hypothetical protein HK405_010991, partial [Cladochytrium tenue]